ncbi:MAG: isoprenoid biosynthesis glyoxalase ElbB [Pseudobdellovibrionaceae bacterium]
MAKKIAVVLSGCGNKDGTEITEAVSLIVGLSSWGAEITYFAPNIEFTPRNFLTGEALSEKRNLMVEAARISRSEMQDLQDLNADHFDGLAFPGGFGAALHLSNWAEAGANCKVHPQVEKVILDFYKQSKPIAAICIAPTLLAKVLGPQQVTITLGTNPEIAKEVEKMGAQHEACPVTDYITDRHHKVVTSPAYMQKAKPHEVFQGISGLVKEFIEMA